LSIVAGTQTELLKSAFLLPAAAKPSRSVEKKRDQPTADPAFSPHFYKTRELPQAARSPARHLRVSEHIKCLERSSSKDSKYHVCHIELIPLACCKMTPFLIKCQQLILIYVYFAMARGFYDTGGFCNYHYSRG
jgi:hypothetical protein